MMKRLSIALILILLLAACNGNDADTGSDEEETAVSSQTSPNEQDSADVVDASDETVEEETAVEATEVEPTATEETVAEPTAIPATLTPPPPPPEEDEEPVVETVAEPAATQPSSETVMIEASDGLQIVATYSYPGGEAPYPGVILLHMLGSQRTAWESNGMEAQLLLNGYAVMTVDMRGHGETGGDIDWELAEDDFQRVWDYFVAQDEVNNEATAVVGASIGSNMSLITAVNEPRINAVILLSPGLDYRGVTTADAIIEYGDRPIFIIASEEDSYAADSSKTLHETATGQAELQLYNGAGHGTNMFSKEEGLPDLILNWLQQYIS